MSKQLVILAGKKAMQIIERHGLRPEMVKVVVGTAGGPKWLVLHGLDRAIFGSWLKERTAPLFLLGSSIGAWRFAAVSQNNPAEALDRFLSAYTEQHYQPNPSPAEIALEGARILGVLLGHAGTGEILNHPFLRLSLVAARCRWPVASDNRVLLSLGLMDAILYNAVHRSALKLFFERTFFYDPREIPPFLESSESPGRVVPLSEKNLHQALLASASIPLLMTGVKNIPEAPKGIYRDGGAIDYHFDLPFMGSNGDSESVVLYPHYLDRVIPGWFDKNLPWRKPHASNMDRVILVSPSREFIERLPCKKLPDRNDFTLFKGRDDDRIAYWNAVIEASKGLGEEFLELVGTSRILTSMQPICGPA
jgi:hypothetical protein